jgi:hypothetical protein
MAQPSFYLQPDVLSAFFHRWTARLYRPHYGDHGNEGHPGVRDADYGVTIRLVLIQLIAVLLHRILIAHFTFEPAYEGQMANPTAAITMSELSSNTPCSRE